MSVAVLLVASLAWLPSQALGQTCPASRQELDSQARELRESVRQLEAQKSRLGYSGTDLQKRNQLSDLITRKRDELSAVESLRSSISSRPSPSTIELQEKRLLYSEARGTREEIRALENEKSKLGYSDADLRRRNELSDLISRKRAVLNAEEAQKSSPLLGGQSEKRLERQTLDAEVRELTEEIRALEKEKSRLGYSGTELRRRTEISDLVSRKRDLLSAKERLRNQCR
ncbi:MAG: hypothetical protein EXR78_10100 [Deltaproteobacteria bacterium]|nr:hypothetical protein [Deltaproteobacteria bacterium]